MIIHIIIKAPTSLVGVSAIDIKVFGYKPDGSIIDTKGIEKELWNREVKIVLPLRHITHAILDAIKIAP